MNFTKLITTGAIAAIAATALVTTVANAGEKVRWKMHSAFGTNLAVLGRPGPYVADAVRAMSGGDFDIKVFEPGALAGGYAYYDPISQGAFEVAFGTPGANQGKNSAFAFASSWPFGPGTGEFLGWLTHGGGEELIAEIYARDNIKFVLCGMIPPETSGWFREEIKTLDQLKGLKMRFFGMGALVMQKFGVSTQLLAGGDIYPALELGTIDATEFSMPAIDRSLGFYQLAKYNYYPGWHQQATTNEMLINMDKWNALPPAYQVMFETACRANIALMIADGESAQFEAMIANEADGVKNMVWSDEMLDAFRAAWDEVVVEEIADNPDAQALWASFQEFHKGYVIWGERGYLK